MHNRVHGIENGGRATPYIPAGSMIHRGGGIVGFDSVRSRTIRFDCADNGGALISVHNCLPALNGAGSIFN